MDTIKNLAQEQHFYTAEIVLLNYGRVIVAGDQAAVERIRNLVEGQHELIELPRDE